MDDTENTEEKTSSFDDTSNQQINTQNTSLKNSEIELTRIVQNPTKKRTICRYHSTMYRARSNMLEHCGRLKKEYVRLTQLTAGRVPGTFFSSKANVMSQIIEIMEEELTRRQVHLYQCIKTTTIVKDVPDPIINIIVQYVPL